MTIAQPSNPERDPGNWQGTFIEQLAAIGDAMGLSRTVTRLLAWLVVCDPPYQSARQLQAGLQLSAGSVSTGVNALVHGGFVRRLALPGDRHRYYEIGPDGWRRLLAGQLQVVGEIRRITDQAMEAAGPGADRRLVDMGRFYARCEPMLADLLDRVPS
jgi:DNA-binding transcriptional regulator GbsR (MarR family)